VGKESELGNQESNGRSLKGIHEAGGPYETVTALKKRKGRNRANIGLAANRDKKLEPFQNPVMGAGVGGQNHSVLKGNPSQRRNLLKIRNL